MALDLLKRAEKGSALTATEYDATLTAIETHAHPISEIIGLQTALDLVNVLDYGAVGNGSTNDITALQAAVTAAVSDGRRGIYLPYTANGYAVDSAWAIPGTIDVIQEAPVIYTGSANIACITIGVTNVQTFQKTYKLWAIRQSLADWTSDANVGIDLINPNQCKIEVVEAARFTVGLRAHGLGSNAGSPVGATWSQFTLRYFVENGCDVDLVADGVGGFCNQNIFIGGSFNSSSTAPNATQNKVGVRMRMINSSANLPNNNTFYSPSFEFHAANRSGETIPIHILNGRFNRFFHCRHETNDPLFMRVAGNSWTNIAEIGYTEHTAFASLLEDTQVGYNQVMPQEVLFSRLLHDTTLPTLTFASPVAWDLSPRPRAQLTLTGSVTINVTDGSQIGGFRGTYTLVVFQDGAGNRVLTLGTGFVSSPATAPLETAASSATVLTFVGNGTGLILG